MWSGVTARFSQFQDNLCLTDIQIADGMTKYRGLTRCLNSYYYNSTSESNNSLLIGSWGKQTQVRPPRDIDLYFLLPLQVFYRFQKYAGNRQSALLQEVRSVIGRTYPATTIRGDGQVVVVAFASNNAEVVPAFPANANSYLICDTHDGGRYKETSPIAEAHFIQDIHTANNNNLRPIIRMLKAWQSHCNVPLKSFFLELLAAEFLPQYRWRLQGCFFYDWIMRDFFRYLCGKVNGIVHVPGTREPIFLGNAWESRTLSAYNRAVTACEHERMDWTYSAGREWQKIFGPQIPVHV